MSAHPDIEAVIGLEVHAELLTRSKIFCGCSAAFGGQPNTNVCPVCLGMPGVLPALNRKVVEFAVKTGLALGCTIQRKSVWALALHVAYWDYAVRRLLDGSARGGFPRAPSNWPTPPARPDARVWSSDVALLRDEHDRLVDAVLRVDPGRLDRRPPGSKQWTYGELLVGIAMHDAYHPGQIQLHKRLWQDR